MLEITKSRFGKTIALLFFISFLLVQLMTLTTLRVSTMIEIVSLDGLEKLFKCKNCYVLCFGFSVHCFLLYSDCISTSLTFHSFLTT